jgi:CO dehydrogenase nickel-insertion accessory protein CooC1
LLGELEGDGQVVIGDLEAGIGTILRLRPGVADAVLVVAQPTAKALDIAGRAARVATSRDMRVVIVGNRLRDEADVSAIRSALGRWEVVAVPDDPAILRADRDARAPIDAAGTAPGVAALVDLAHRLTDPVLVSAS